MGIEWNRFKQRNILTMKRIENLDELLTADNVNGSIIELDNFICEACSCGDDMNILTDPQRTFYYNQNLESEINKGGFNQYFIDRKMVG